MGQSIPVQLTTETAPRRVCTPDYRTESAGQDERGRLVRWLGELAREGYIFFEAHHFYSRNPSRMAFGQETLIV